MQKTWKSIKDFEGKYEVSNTGKVRGLDRFVFSVKGGNNKAKIKGRLLNPYKNAHGYLKVKLSNGRKNGKLVSVHRLVAIHFIKNPEEKPDINHLDGDKENNFPENLEWCTKKENLTHAKKNNLIATGHKINTTKLSEKEVLEIRKKYIPWKYSQRRLAKEYGVSRVCIQSIIKRETWKYL